MPRLADSLAGRMEIVPLWPMSSAELEGQPLPNRAEWLARCEGDDDPTRRGHVATPRDRLIETLMRGGFPEAASRPSAGRRGAWFDAYLQAVIQRDVRELAHIEQLHELPNLMALLATRSGGLLNIAELSRTSGLPQSTLKRYLVLLETLYLVQRVAPWERNAAKRLVKTPKLYVPDSGLLGHLAGWNAAAVAAPRGLPGAWVESWVLGELLRHLAFSSAGLSLWHYRTQTGHEVDFLLEDRQGGLVGIEVKAAASLGDSDFKGLRHLQDTEPQRFRRGVVLYGGDEVIAFGRNLWALPLGVWWAAA